VSSGEASYHPSVLLGLLVYGYATGMFSSRKLERATYDSVAFRYIAANQHPEGQLVGSGHGVAVLINATGAMQTHTTPRLAMNAR
jgi:hypothetical protein